MLQYLSVVMFAHFFNFLAQRAVAGRKWQLQFFCEIMMKPNVFFSSGWFYRYVIVKFQCSLKIYCRTGFSSVIFLFCFFSRSFSIPKGVSCSCCQNNRSIFKQARWSVVSIKRWWHIYSHSSPPKVLCSDELLGVNLLCADLFQLFRVLTSIILVFSLSILLYLAS